MQAPSTTSKGLQELLHIQYPIISAPMAYVAGGKLAGAVSKAGGLGLIGAGYGDFERKEFNETWIKAQFDLAHAYFPDYDPSAGGRSPVGIGFINWPLAKDPRLLHYALTFKPKVVMLSFGDPLPFVEPIHAAGALLACQVQTLEGARKAAALGADIVVTQGLEAGGHIRANGRSSMSFIPAVVDALAATNVAVVAAGGIADGRGVTAALALGAHGVLLGTRFLVTKESLAHPKTKKKVAESAGDDTFVTRLWDELRKLEWPPEFAARTVRNSFSEEWENKKDQLTQLELEAFYKARDECNFSVYTVWCGENVDLIDNKEGDEENLPSAADILQRLITETKNDAQRTRKAIQQW